MKYLPLLLLLLTAGCTAHPYTVCRGEDYCTPGLSHEEAVRASEIKKTWQDEKLYVRPVKNSACSQKVVSRTMGTKKFILAPNRLSDLTQLFATLINVA